MHGHYDHASGSTHPKRPDVEDLPMTESQWLETAVRELLVGKGVFGGSDLHRRLEVIDAWTPALSACLVARAWVDPTFKRRLLFRVFRFFLPESLARCGEFRRGSVFYAASCGQDNGRVVLPPRR